MIALFVIGFIAGGAAWLAGRAARRSPVRAGAEGPARVTRKVPLALRRIASREGGDLVLEAMEASGGWDAWRAHRAASFTLDGVFFGPNGEITETRSERVTVRLDQPLRIRIEAADGSSLIGFGNAGAWGAGRQSDGRFNPALGPGSLPRSTLRDLALDAAWVFGLPFNLGDADAEFHRDPSSSDADSLNRLTVSYPPAPGDSAARVRRLGFDPESGHILEVVFTGPAPEPAPSPEGREAGGGSAEAGPGEAGPGAAVGYFLLSLRGYTDFDGVWRPVRRALFEADSTGRPLRRIYEQRLGGVVWDPPVQEEMFEPPPAP